MKKFLSIVAMCLASLSVMAQSSLVATLTHEGTTTSYEGQRGFEFALADALDGDLITLSGGTFVMSGGEFLINKKLIIRGNGMDGQDPTILNSPVLIEKNSEPTLGLKFEGIKFNGEISTSAPNDQDTPNIVDGVTFVKCTINTIKANGKQTGNWQQNGYGTFKNMTLINCKCMSACTFYNDANVSFINSILAANIVTGSSWNENNGVSVTLEHSILMHGGQTRDIMVAVFKNSIISANQDYYRPDTYAIIPSACKFENCIITGFVDNAAVSWLFNACQQTNTEYKPMADVFKTCTVYKGVTDDTYELTDAAKALLSTDGTERGIYGGAAPFSSVVSYPRFTTFEVADKAVDGKLSVTIATE